MASEFQAGLISLIHGRYSIGGTSYLYLHPGQQQCRRVGTELHESVHSELLDNSAYGRFQQMLHTTAKTAPAGAFRKRCSQLLQLTTTACAITHEGFAAYREFCWLVSNEGQSSAKQYLQAVPADYRRGMEQVTHLLGDPFTKPYQGLSPPAFHTLLITVGSALLNTPILLEYTNPERIFHEPLSWVLVDAPDQRLAHLDAHAEHLSAIVRQLAAAPMLETALLASILGNDAFELQQFWDFGIETLRQAQPGVPMLTKTEVDAQVVPFNAAWIEHLNRQAGRTVAIRGPVRKDTSGERSLNTRLYPANYSQHEGQRAQAQAVPVELLALADIALQLKSPNIRYLGMLSTLDPDPSFEGFLQRHVAMLALPMWAGSSAVESPWASFAPTFVTESTVDAFLHTSQGLAAMGWSWYANQTVVTFLRELGCLPSGLLLERCSDPKHLLLGLEHARRLGSEGNGYCVAHFTGQEDLVGIVYDNSFAFSFVTMSALLHFEKTATEYGITKLSEASLRVGQQALTLDIVARWARWGAFGA